MTTDSAAPPPKSLPQLAGELLPGSSGAAAAELARVEARLGCPLHDDHRQLLTLANGGAPKRACYRHDGVSIFLQYIWGIEAPSGPSEEELEGLESRLLIWSAPAGPRQLVPVARGGQDDELSISLVDGSVHYLESSDPYREPFEQSRLLEDSLAALLGKLDEQF